jgi:hypothetical protein
LTHENHGRRQLGHQPRDRNGGTYERTRTESPNDHVSFAELANRFPGFAEGEHSLCLGDDNMVLWSGMTQEAVTIISELLNENAVHAHPSTLLVYLVDGRHLTLPIPKTTRKLTKPHWVPVTLRPYPLDKPSRRKVH